ncbi:MAG: YigZ family protein [Candidatus Sabulitectum sp.]|nr:YigZ family protein [Candidatus Sabulitectum sp.]
MKKAFPVAENALSLRHEFLYFTGLRTRVSQVLSRRFLIGNARTLKETVSGTSILEKQSRFQACGTPFLSGNDQSITVKSLSRQFKMKKASHLSWAIRLTDGTELKNDGGESGSGNCILEAMRSMNAVDCLILVARWYGGKHLGGLRFRIYRNSTKKLLTEFSSIMKTE